MFSLNNFSYELDGNNLLNSSDLFITIISVGSYYLQTGTIELSLGNNLKHRITDTNFEQTHSLMKDNIFTLLIDRSSYPIKGVEKAFRLYIDSIQGKHETTYQIIDRIDGSKEIPVKVELSSEIILNYESDLQLEIKAVEDLVFTIYFAEYLNFTNEKKFNPDIESPIPEIEFDNQTQSFFNIKVGKQGLAIIPDFTIKIKDTFKFDIRALENLSVDVVFEDSNGAIKKTCSINDKSKCEYQYLDNIKRIVFSTNGVKVVNLFLGIYQRNDKGLIMSPGINKPFEFDDNVLSYIGFAFNKNENTENRIFLDFISGAFYGLTYKIIENDNDNAVSRPEGIYFNDLATENNSNLQLFSLDLNKTSRNLLIIILLKANNDKSKKIIPAKMLTSTDSSKSYLMAYASSRISSSVVESKTITQFVFETQNLHSFKVNRPKDNNDNMLVSLYKQDMENSDCRYKIRDTQILTKIDSKSSRSLVIIDNLPKDKEEFTVDLFCFRNERNLAYFEFGLLPTSYKTESFVLPSTNYETTKTNSSTSGEKILQFNLKSKYLSSVPESKVTYEILIKEDVKTEALTANKLPGYSLIDYLYYQKDKALKLDDTGKVTVKDIKTDITYYVSLFAKDSVTNTVADYEITQFKEAGSSSSSSSSSRSSSDSSGLPSGGLGFWIWLLIILGGCLIIVVILLVVRKVISDRKTTSEIERSLINSTENNA